MFRSSWSPTFSSEWGVKASPHTLEPTGAGRGRLASVEDHVAVGIAPNKIADAENVENTGPAVGMDGDGFAGTDVGVEYAHVLVLEEQLVMIRCRSHGVELGWPWPGFLLRIAHSEPPSAR